MKSFTFLNRILGSLIILSLGVSFLFAENDVNKLSIEDKKQCEKMEGLLIDNENYRYHKVSICNRSGVKKYINNNFDSYHSCYSNARVFIIIDKATNKVLGLTKLDFFYYEESDEYLYTYTVEEVNKRIKKRIKEGFYLDNPDSREFDNYNKGYLVDILGAFNIKVNSLSHNYNKDNLPFKVIFSKTKPINLDIAYLKINNCFIDKIKRYKNGK